MLIVQHQFLTKVLRRYKYKYSKLRLLYLHCGCVETVVDVYLYIYNDLRRVYLSINASVSK